MSRRPQALSVAAILLVLLNLFNFPWPYEIFFPGWKNHRPLSFTRDMLWALWASSSPSDCGCCKGGATGPPSSFVYLTCFRERRGYSWRQGLH